jgi:hypothetical protein
MDARRAAHPGPPSFRTQPRSSKCLCEWPDSNRHGVTHWYLNPTMPRIHRSYVSSAALDSRSTLAVPRTVVELSGQRDLEIGRRKRLLLLALPAGRRDGSEPTGERQAEVSRGRNSRRERASAHVRDSRSHAAKRCSRHSSAAETSIACHSHPGSQRLRLTSGGSRSLRNARCWVAPLIRNALRGNADDVIPAIVDVTHA